MTTDAIHERSDRERLVVNVEGTRDIGPAEAEGLLRECLVLTHKRFDAAIWRAIERLQALGPGNDDELGTSLAASELAHEVARAVASKRSLVVPSFKARFDEAFQRRREGKSSLRGHRDEIKAVFGRLQIPMLKAALIDRRVLYDSQHPTRRFLDTLAAASVDLKPDDEHDRMLIKLANGLATRIRDEFVDDLGIFETAKRELEAFLDAERASSNQQLAKTVPLLIAQDEAAAARDEAVAAIEARLAGRTVTAEIRAFLDNDCVERLTAIDLEQGSESSAWERQLDLIDDLLASIGPKTTAASRKALVRTLPELLLRINRSWAADDEVELRRQSLLSSLLNLHIGSMKASTGATPGTAATAAPGGAIAPAAISAGTVAAQEPDDFDDRVQALVRGDWCAFTDANVPTPVLARLACRAPQRKRLLFSHRDGSTAFVHTPESLAEAFRTERATLAIEAVPRFDRAMARLIDRRSPTSTSAAAVAA